MNARMTKIKTALEEIAAKNRGRLAAEKVVEAARSPRHPLHDEFEWSDQKAAHQHRLAQARELITYVTITVVHAPIKISSPYYVRDPRLPVNQQGHIALTSEAVKYGDAQQILVSEVDRIEGCVSRARGVATLLDEKFPGLKEDLEAMLTRLVTIRARVSPAPLPPTPGSGKRRKPSAGGEALAA